MAKLQLCLLVDANQIECSRLLIEVLLVRKRPPNGLLRWKCDSKI